MTVAVPPEWWAEAEDDSILVGDRDGVGCIEISTLHKDIGEFQPGDRVALQGNMDPMMLFASPERIREEVAGILSGFGHGSGHVFNLGHGITPDVDPDNLAALIRAVREFSPAYHQD